MTLLLNITTDFATVAMLLDLQSVGLLWGIFGVLGIF